jgi:hypothetical protein
MNNSVLSEFESLLILNSQVFLNILSADLGLGLLVFCVIPFEQNEPLSLISNVLVTKRKHLHVNADRNYDTIRFLRG